MNFSASVEVLLFCLANIGNSYFFRNVVHSIKILKLVPFCCIFKNLSFDLFYIIFITYDSLFIWQGYKF